MSMRQVLKRASRRTYKDNGGLESKRPVDWPRILLAIIMTFGHCDAASKPTSKDFYVSLLSKARAAAMWQPQIVTGADSLIEGFIHEFKSLRHSTERLFPPIRKAAAMIPILSLSIDLQRYQVITNSDRLSLPVTCHGCAMFYSSDAVFLPRSICKPAALPKGQIATRGAYL